MKKGNDLFMKKMDVEREVTTKADAPCAVFFTEGGHNSGLGHIARCVALSRAFGKKGITSKIIVDGDSSVDGLLSEVSFVRKDWIGSRVEVFGIIKKTDVVVVDSYRADRSFYTDVSGLCRLVVCFDDNMRLDYPEGTVVNGSMGAETLGYDKKPGTEYLLGVKYMCLRPEFESVPEWRTRADVKSILITFGGNDIRGLTSIVLSSLVRRFPNVTKKVIIGPATRSEDSFFVKNLDNTEMIFAPSASKIRDVMCGVDMAVTAGGQTLYELARVGVPAVVVGVADNQLGNIAGWEKAGAIKYSGFWDAPDIERRIISDCGSLLVKGIREEMSSKGRCLMDGEGAERVVNKVFSKVKV